MSESGEMELDSKTYAEFQKLIHLHTGITIAENRKSMVQGRLSRRMRAVQVTDYKSYLAYLATKPEERQFFIDAVTTNETYFYRTPRIWDYIEKELVPAWIQKNPVGVFNAWSAAASSGDEAYTLGMILQQFKEKNPGFHYQITGTDISSEILRTAEKGEYNGRSLEMMRVQKPDLFKKYMRTLANGSCEVLPEIRSQIRFYMHNLFERPKFNIAFDLVLIRNVLIYFVEPDQEKVLSHIRSKMKKDASLIIGESESLTRLKTEFLYQKPLIYKTPGAA